MTKDASMNMNTHILQDIMQNPYAEIGYKLHLLLSTGQLLMSSGADTSRIVRDMTRVAAYMGIPWNMIHLHITYTTLMLNISDDEHSYTSFRKCKTHGINMTTISAVSKLTWRAMEEKYTLWKYDSELEKIRCRQRFYSPLVTALGAGFACGGFCKLFGCDWLAFFYTAICAAIGFGVRRQCNKWGINQYGSIAIAAFIATFLAYLTHWLPGSATPWHPMLASTLFIVPGIPLINAVDDLLNNFIISGTTRGLDTVLTGGGMTFGIITAINLCHMTDFTSLSTVPNSSFLVYALAAGIAAVGFSMIFNVPPRLLFVAAIGGAIAVCLRNYITLQLGYSQMIGSFFGAAVVGLIGLKAMHWVHTPFHVLAVPSVIPMIPGVLLYRFLLGIINIGNIEPLALLKAVQNGIEAILIIVGIAVGATIPNIVAHKRIEHAKQVQLEEMLEDFRSLD